MWTTLHTDLTQWTMRSIKVRAVPLAKLYVLSNYELSIHEVPSTSTKSGYRLELRLYSQQRAQVLAASDWPLQRKGMAKPKKRALRACSPRGSGGRVTSSAAYGSPEDDRTPRFVYRLSSISACLRAVSPSASPSIRASLVTRSRPASGTPWHTPI